MKKLSHLIESVPGSPTTLMMQKGRELAAAGHAIVNLAGGEPDFNTPQHIIDETMPVCREPFDRREKGSISDLTRVVGNVCSQHTTRAGNCCFERIS